MVCEHTLRIRNLPYSLSDQEKEDFLRHFGAISVKILNSITKQKTIAFAKFENKQIAKAVMQRLHQLKVLDCILFVEYATNDISEGRIKIKSGSNEETVKNKHYKSFITKLHGFNNAVSFNQPPPSHLMYNYPKANRATINNIAHALATVPKFYVQVLHLMNRFNLPPPFSDVPDNLSLNHTSLKPVQDTPQKETSESEMESDDNDDDNTQNIIPAKRNMPQKRIVKRPKFIKPSVKPVANTKETSRDEVFEKVEIQSRKIEVKLGTDSSVESLPQIPIEVTEITPLEVDNPTEQNLDSQKSDYISENELEANRIPAQDLSVIPIFKDYHPGVPSCRLYVKNIAKSVEKSDFEFIYGRYKTNAPEEMFDIRLMQEGRMKGQAFVTLNSIEVAQKAVKETNGYILKDKALVVVFGKTPVQK